MGIWFPSPALADGELVRWQAAANGLRGRRSIGGQLTLTDKRVIFVPNRLDGATGGRRVEMLLSDVQDVRTLAPGREAVEQRGLAAAIRQQVEIVGRQASLTVTVRDVDALSAAVRGN